MGGIPGGVTCGKRCFDGAPGVTSRGPRERPAQVFGGRYRTPAVEYAARLRQGQDARLEIAFRMLDLPVRATLQEFQVTSVDIEREPAALTARLRDLLVGITNVLEVEFPVFVGLIGQMLRLAGNGVDLPPRGADFLDDSLVPIAP